MNITPAPLAVITRIIIKKRDNGITPICAMRWEIMQHYQKRQSQAVREEIQHLLNNHSITEIEVAEGMALALAVGSI